MRVKVVDGFPFRPGGGLAGGFPALKSALAFVARDFVAAQGSADELPVAQVAGLLAGLGFELRNKAAHGANELTTDGHGWTRIKKNRLGRVTPCAPPSVLAQAAGRGLPPPPPSILREAHPCLSVFSRGGNYWWFKTSARLIVLVGLPWRDSKPWMCIRQLESLETMYSAPVSAGAADFTFPPPAGGTGKYLAASQPR